MQILFTPLIAFLIFFVLPLSVCLEEDWLGHPSIAKSNPALIQAASYPRQCWRHQVTGHFSW